MKDKTVILENWIPAFAGMTTTCKMSFPRRRESRKTPIILLPD
jgi:hypothetical protein